MTRTRQRAVAAVLACGFGVLMAVLPQTVDLDVYMSYSAIVLHGADDLYAYLPGYHLPFTYPPFAALLFAPFALLPAWAQSLLLATASMLCLMRCCELLARRLPGSWTPWLLLALGLALEPVIATFSHGQVNLVLMWLVLEGLSSRRAAWQGVSVGLAMGFKLTPGIFLLYLAVTRRWRAFFIACGTGAATVLVALAVLPRSSWEFWTSAMLDPTRVGGLAYSSNQAINGALWRAVGPGGSRLAWVVAALVVLALGAWIVRRLDDRDPLAGIVTAALVGLLVSPVSWSHHWVWVLPALVVLAGASLGGRPEPLMSRFPHQDVRKSTHEGAVGLLAGAWVFVCVTWTTWWMPSAENREYDVAWWGKLLTDSYTLLGLATLAWLAVSASGSRRPRAADPAAP